MRKKILLAVAIAVMVIFVGTAHSDVLLSDDFNSEPLGPNWNNFANWNVTSGFVDVIGPS